MTDVETLQSSEPMRNANVQLSLASFRDLLVLLRAANVSELDSRDVHESIFDDTGSCEGMSFRVKCHTHCSSACALTSQVLCRWNAA